MKVMVTVDRIEEGLAVLEVGDQMVDWPLAALPEGVREGDRIELGMRRCPAADRDEAQERLERLRAASPQDDGEIDL